MTFDDDRWWHLGLLLTIRMDHVLLHICFTEDKQDNLMLRLGRDGKGERLDLQDHALCNRRYDELVSQIINAYTAKPQDEAPSSSSLKKIGFEPPTTHTDAGAA